MSLKIRVSLRTAASMEAHLTPMLLLLTLRVKGGARMVREQLCQGALTEKQTLGVGGALERGHGASLERLAELGDALGGVGAGPLVSDTAELVSAQAAKGRRSVNGR